MRRFLLAFAILSVIVLCQNVTTGTSLPVTGETPEASAQAEMGLEVVSPTQATQAGLVVGGRTPEPVALLLMMTGLSGLAVAGNRPIPEQETARA